MEPRRFWKSSAAWNRDLVNRRRNRRSRDLVRTIVVDSTVVARIRRSEIVSNHNIKKGDLIVGLASYGKTTYEKEYNSGIGSNGLTSARHDVFANYLAKKYPESFDAGLPSDIVYSGSLS